MRPRTPIWAARSRSRCSARRRRRERAGTERDRVELEVVPRAGGGDLEEHEELFHTIPWECRGVELAIRTTIRNPDRERVGTRRGIPGGRGVGASSVELDPARDRLIVRAE